MSPDRPRTAPLSLLLPCALFLAGGLMWPAAFAQVPELTATPADETPANQAPMALDADVASESDAATDEAITTLQAIVVTGIQPGPGLWQVRRGENTLWIVATLSPLPKRMEWEPRELDALVAKADRILSPPGVSVDADIGFFGRLRLVPSALRARNNPDDSMLVDVMSPELYARWTVQKERYMGRDRGVEKRRPFIAAYELMDEALGDLDLKRENIVWDRVERIARRNDREILPVRVEIKIDDPRQALREFETGQVDDLGCMEATIARLETDTEAMVERANAWAVGDIQTLETLRIESEIRACALAILGTEALRKRGFDDLPARVVAEWVRVAEETLTNHASSVAVADFQVLTNPDGLLAALRAKGFEVIPPTDPLATP